MNEKVNKASPLPPMVIVVAENFFTNFHLKSSNGNELKRKLQL